MKKTALNRNQMKSILGGVAIVDDSFGCNECSSTKGCNDGYVCEHDWYPGCYDGQRYQCIKEKK